MLIILAIMFFATAILSLYLLLHSFLCGAAIPPMTWGTLVICIFSLIAFLKRKKKNDELEDLKKENLKLQNELLKKKDNE